MRSVLVTGGAGFIGSNFIHYLIGHYPEVHVVNLDALTYAGNLGNLDELSDPTRHTFIHGDICDRDLLDSLFRQYEIDTVVHFAAETHVDRSIIGPEQFITTNIIGTSTLLEATRQAWLGDQIVPVETTRFHHVSTDEVYGTLGPHDPAFTETTPYSPNSPYAASKASSDHLVRAYFRTYHLPVTITNCSNNYGPYQYPEKLIPLMILNAIAGKSLPIYGDGMQVRDWLYVEDHCEAIDRVLNLGQLGETYNVGGDNQPSNLLIVNTLCEILDEFLPASRHAPHAQLIQHVADRPGHDRRYDIDITKIGQDLGWKPKKNLREGLVATVGWYLNHPEWVERIREHASYQTWVEQNYAERGPRENQRRGGLER